MESAAQKRSKKIPDRAFYKHNRDRKGNALCMGDQSHECTRGADCPRIAYHNICAQCQDEGHVAVDCTAMPIGAKQYAKVQVRTQRRRR